MIIFILAVVAVFALLLLIHWLWSKAKPSVPLKIVFVVSMILLGSIGMLIASGRMHWLLGIGAFVLPFLRRAFTLIRLAPMVANFWQLMGGRATASPFGQAFENPFTRQSNDPGSSHTETSYIRMKLDHGSGELEGEVLKGPYSTRELSSLSRTEIVDLYNNIDTESKRLLGAFIQRYHPDLASENTEEEEQTASSSSDAMTVEKARKVLGVEEGATRDQIVEAHRRLMQKNHPDRGGSEFIASEINQAKDTLLKHI